MALRLLERILALELLFGKSALERNESICSPEAVYGAHVVAGGTICHESQH